jgi:outer membrane receptor protein involved in Fe transport
VTAPFTLGTFNQDLGPIVSHTHRSSTQAQLGAQGDFEALGSKWTWDAYAQRTDNPIYTDADVSITSRYNQAIDAVRSANGTIVCRSTLTNPTNGCVPLDILGTGVVSAAARNYVLGTSWGRTDLTQDVFAGTLRGELFSTWAGPISVATGIEHRREAVSGSNDPLTTATTKPYFAGNFFASFGSYDVTEGFLETVVPLAKDLTFAKSLDFNGAVRATDYSTSGYVTTWKLGLTYSPIDDLSLRTTRSRDIRAPNLAELFQSGQTSTTSITDPFRGNAATTVAQITSGNLNLKPEVADTLGVGVVLQPRFLSGFAASVDYYDIRIENAISTPNAATLVNECFLGNTTYCSQITRNTAGAITTVAVLPVNVATQISRGVDFETGYRRPLLQGNLSLRLLATHFLENYSNDGITPATDNVGTNGMNGSLRNTLPRWRYLASIGWDRGPVALSFAARGFSAGVNNTSYIQCTSGCPASTVANMTIDDNHLPGAIYFDTSLTVSFPHGLETFLAVDNLANKDPGIVPYGTAIGGAPLNTNPILYDVLGRTFRLGLRFKM